MRQAIVAVGLLFGVMAARGGAADPGEAPARRPNLLILLADQWRADATGYGGDPNVKTPNLDRLAAQSANFTMAVSNIPVCTPYRACLMTGQGPLRHGLFLNDVPLPDAALTLAEVLAAAGYETAYVGKWHLDGRGRSAYIPPERRQGFAYWKVLECTHNYMRSAYYGDTPEKLQWEGYDAIAQTHDVQRFIRDRAGAQRPFFLMLSWGPPHNPYETAPSEFRQLYDPATLALRPNVPESMSDQARADLAGYYAHCSALDHCVGEIWGTLRELGLEDETLLVFTSDHGDMLGSHGQSRKQKPWDESIRVPLLMHCPRLLGHGGMERPAPIGAIDLMPTLLGLCGVAVPDGVEGLDFSAYARGGPAPSDGAVLILCPSPFGEWHRANGGKEYRGIRTARYTYVRDLDGPWLLYDNARDPYQLVNLCGEASVRQVQDELESVLRRKLEATADAFLPGPRYIERWRYAVDDTGTVRYAP